MKEVVINAIFGWLFRAPLLYNPTDWLMAISQIYVLRQGYKALRSLTNKYIKEQKYKYEVAMKENYPKLKGKCKICLGCNQLELKSFSGVYECKNYMKGSKNEQTRICSVQGR